MTTLVGQKKGKNIEVSTDGKRLAYSGSREYLVYDQSGNAGEGDVLVTAGLPSVNLLYNFDGVPLALTCKKKSAQQWETNNKYWTVSADFDNEPQSDEQQTGGNETDTQDPTAWYAIIKFDFETFDEVQPWWTNYAKRPYQSALSVTNLIPVIKFTQYLGPQLSVYDLIQKYHNVVNESKFLNGDARFWKLTIADAEYGVTNGYQCWKVDFELRYKKSRIPSFIYDDDGIRIISYTDEDQAIMYPGWDAYVPQVDTVDINKTPFEDFKKNSGDLGKLNVDGVFLTNQDAPVVIRRHLLLPETNFNFIRIRQNNN